MALSPEQQRIANLILAIGNKMGATPKEKLAAIETGLVESGLRNLSGGDGDSAGWRQERASLYRDPTNLTHSITRFFQEARAARGKYGTAGQLAAAVQRPREDLRGKYQDVRPEALQIIQGMTGRTVDQGGRTITKTTRPGATTVGATSGDLSALLPLLQASLKQRPGPQITAPDPGSVPGLQMATPDMPAQTPVVAQQDQSQSPSLDDLLGAITQLSGPSVNVKTAPSTTTTTVTGSAGHHPQTVRDVLALRGTANFDGKKVAAWVGHILNYARAHGWKGSVSSGYRSDAEQTRIYDSGVRPAAKPKSEGGPGSNHEGTVYPLGAADVTDPQGLAEVLRNSPYASILQWAGQKDPVHFSHPHGGGY